MRVRVSWLCAQMMDAVWLSMLLSASAGMLAVTVVVATFYFIRSAGPVTGPLLLLCICCRQPACG